MKLHPENPTPGFVPSPRTHRPITVLVPVGLNANGLSIVVTTAENLADTLFRKQPDVVSEACTEWTPAHPPKRPTTDEIYNKMFPGDPYDRQ